MRTFILVLFSLLCGVLWLLILEASAFNGLVVGVGLMGALVISPKGKGAVRS